MDSLVSILISTLGGGVIGAIVTALVGKKKVDAEAQNTNVQSMLDIDKRMEERMALVEARSTRLEEENFALRCQVLSLEHALSAAGIPFVPYCKPKGQNGSPPAEKKQ